ncbi:hypothetical protein BM527_16600 [Alteromonas sp. Mex14]|nr:hypothetical protein BM527_16600 [Alteromonas sp. Mex14]
MIRIKSTQRQQGAALLSALVISVILVLLVSITSALMEKRIRLAEQSLAQLDAQAKVHQKAQELTYLISTQRITFAGLATGKNRGGQSRIDGLWTTQLSGDEIRADGFEYKETIDGVEITYSIQAENGLIPINTSEGLWRKQWLNAYGIDDARISILEDTLIDYADPDEWARAAGAERVTYIRERRAPPSNFLLQSCSELMNIFEWDLLLQSKPELIADCSLSRSARVNLNAIPLALWKKIWPNSFEAIKQARATGQWITNESQALSASPDLIRLPPVYLYYKGLHSFIVNVKSGGISVTKKVVTQRGLLPPYKLFPFDSAYDLADNAPEKVY